MIEQTPSSPELRGRPEVSAVEDEEISLLDIAVVMAKHRNLIVGLPLVVAVVAAVYALLLPNIYTADTRILPPAQSQSAASAMVAQLGGLIGLTGGAASLRNSNEVYIAMLKSRTVADSLIQRLDLMKRYGAETIAQARQELATSSRFSSGKDGLITVEVEDKDPKHAAELANAYVDELIKFTTVLAVTEASQRRLFFERQLTQAKDNLVKVQGSARQALEQGGLVKVDDQGRAMVENTARLRAQMTAKEVYIGAMRTFATDQNPELQRAKQELDSMKRELAKIEGDGGSRAVPNSKSSRGIDNLGLLRDVKYYETLYELLAKQYELAKIDEAKDSSVLQVMDKAIEPDVRSKPRRRVIVLVSAVVALFAAILLAFVREAIAKAGSNPQQAERLQDIKRYLLGR